MPKKYIIILLIFSLIQISLSMPCVRAIKKSANPNMFIELKLSKNKYINGEYLTAQATLSNKGVADITFEKEAIFGIEASYSKRNLKGLSADCPSIECRNIGGIILKANEIKKMIQIPLHVNLISANFQERTLMSIKAYIKNKDNIIETDPIELTVMPPSTEIDKEAFKYLLCPPPDIRKKYKEEKNIQIECPSASYRFLVYRINHNEILDKYPQSTYAKYVLYTQGLSDLYPYSTPELVVDKSYFPKAIANFEKLLKDYPPFELSDEAMYYLAVAYYNIDMKAKADDLLNQVIIKYPDSDGAEMAKQFLLDPTRGNKKGDL